MIQYPHHVKELHLQSLHTEVRQSVRRLPVIPDPIEAGPLQVLRSSVRQRRPDARPPEPRASRLGTPRLPDAKEARVADEAIHLRFPHAMRMHLMQAREKTRGLLL